MTHRFLVPKFSRDIIPYSFLGSSILIAKILHWLAPVACEQPPRSELLLVPLFGG